MNFTDANCFVFLPNTILLRCLKHFKSYGRIVRPWLGMRTRILDSLKMARLETIYQKFPDINGVFVEKVTEGSPADSAGVRPGDIVTHCDEIPVCSPLEFAEVLFDKAENSMELGCDREVMIMQIRDRQLLLRWL
ncbi:putative protease Do-like 14 [Chenopodium quinoa]|uniref:putative protease Do-like 14 n=1 Tax=Chenopodium quinoa TaxID=63459 RepID=UPI000B77B450|nr:putative protease Do-like 14 [Chenopodium quinoa]